MSDILEQLRTDPGTRTLGQILRIVDESRLLACGPVISSGLEIAFGRSSGAVNTSHARTAK